MKTTEHQPVAKVQGVKPDVSGGRPGYKHTKLGWIPEEWEVKPLVKVGKWRGGGTPSKAVAQYWQGNVPWVSSRDVKQRRLSNTELHISEEGLLNSSSVLLPPNSLILVTRSGILRHTLPVAVNEVQMAINQDIKAMIVDNPKDADYVQFVLEGWNQYFLSTCYKEGTTVESIDFESLKNFRIPWPNSLERSRIAQVLGAWDRAIATVQQLLAAQQERKRGLMQELLEEVFHRCKKMSIGSVAKEITERHTTDEDHIVLSCSKHHGFVSSLKYFKKQVYSEDRSNYKVIRRGQFGFPANHIEEGSIDLLTTHDVGLISPIYVVFQFNEEKVNSAFMYYLFKTDRYRYIFKNSTNASVDRRGSLRWNDFKNLWVPLPKREEQDKLAALFNRMDVQIGITQEHLAQLTTQKRGLMQVLLTGEKRLATKHQ